MTPVVAGSRWEPRECPSNGRSDARFGVAKHERTMKDFFLSIRPSRVVPAFRRRPRSVVARDAGRTTEVSHRNVRTGEGPAHLRRGDGGKISFVDEMRDPVWGNSLEDCFF